MTGEPTLVPRHWYNVTADFPELINPYLDHRTGQPVTAAGLAELFAPQLVEQELDTTHRLIPIPPDILDLSGRWRPTPLLRASRLESQLGTRCRIFYKYEGVSPIGSHKANSGLAQAHYSKRAGLRRVYAETGAGQWGSAISMGSAFFGLDCDVLMVGGSFDAKPARRTLMETFGATVHRSPSEITEVGRKELAADPSSPGSLGIAIAEAVEAAAADPAAAYALGSALNFVCLHQTVIGQELRSQLQAAGIRPDVLISCIGGGSSFAGLVFPFLADKESGQDIDLVAVESSAVPKVTQGRFAYDHADNAGLTPLIKMYTLGHQFAAPRIHSGGLRYHGLSGQVSSLLHLGLARAVSYSQLQVFRAAVDFSKAEGLLPAPEAAHSIAAACQIATERRDEELTIVFCLTGHGFFDLSAYNQFNHGDMDDPSISAETIRDSLTRLGSPMAVQEPARDRRSAYETWRARSFPADSREDLPAGSVNEPTDLRSLKVISERVIREAQGTGPLIVGQRAVVTPAAQTEADRLRRAIVRDRGNG
jgi:tryptophan synthase beta chain